MALEFGQSTFPEISIKLGEAKTWLKRCGIKLEDSRFESIRSRMNLITEGFRNGNLVDLVKEWGDEVMISTLVESQPLINIYEAFKDLRDHEIPRTKLRAVVNGPYLASKEDSIKNTNYCRNILFELELAATLKLKGVDVRRFDDINFLLDRTEFNIECKRPTSRGTVSANIESATKQLQRRIDITRSQIETRGIIGIAVDKVLNADKQIIIAKSSTELERIVDAKITTFVEQNKMFWIKLIDIRVVGVIIYLKYVAEVKETGLLSTGSHVALCARAYPPFQWVDYASLRQLGKLLSPTTRLIADK